MNEPRLSASTKELLRAARSDAPSAAAKAKVWSGVSGVVGGGAGAAGGAAAGAGGAGAGSASAGMGVATTGAAKMLALGTLFGGTVTVGLAVTLLRVGPAPSLLPTPGQPLITAIAPAHTGVAGDPPPAFDPFLAPRTLPPPASAGAGTLAGSCPVTTAPGGGAAPSAGTPPPVHASPARAPLAPSLASVSRAPLSPAALDDAIAREASLVAEARGALVRGDPMSALRIVRVARSLPSHRLGPEELSVEAQALHALGRDEEARETDATLRVQFPESALAR